MPNKELGIFFNQKMLTMILGVIALGGSMAGGVTYFTNQNYEIQNLKTNQEATKNLIVEQVTRLETSNNQRLDKLEANTGERLSKVENSVSDMALAVRELEVRQQTQQSAQLFSYPQQNK